jgi:chromosome segregation ATPase
LHETLQATMPRPKDPAEQDRADQFYKLSSAKGSAAEKKAELLNQQLAMATELIDWEDKIKNIETKLQQEKDERQKIAQEVEQQQQDQQATRTSSSKLQSEIDDLNRQIAQKEKNLNNNTNQQRNETIYLPKLRDAGGKRAVYFVLRFNRLYKVSNRGDFDYTGNMLGIPKRDRGIVVEDTESAKRQIRSIFQNNVSNAEFLSVFVYGDSADQWYIIRDLFVIAKFEYELIPTADDTPWVFGGSGGSSSVQ